MVKRLFVSQRIVNLSEPNQNPLKSFNGGNPSDTKALLLDFFRAWSDENLAKVKRSAALGVAAAGVLVHGSGNVLYNFSRDSL